MSYVHPKIKRLSRFAASGTVIAALMLLTFAGPSFAKPPGGGGKPPKDPPPASVPLKIVLMAGQSMNGSGLVADLPTLAPELLEPQTDVQIYFSDVEHSPDAVWSELGPGFGGNSDKFGPELTFGRDMTDGLPGDNIALIKSRSQGNILGVDWDPITEGTSWTLFLDTVATALASLDPVYDPEIVGMIWLHGAKDAQDETRALAHEANLSVFIAAIRAEFGNPDLPFIIGQMPSIDTEGKPYMSVIAQAQFDTWINTPNTGLVLTDDISDGGNPLFDSAGHLELGSRYASELLDAIASQVIPINVDSVNYSLSGRQDRDLTVTITIVDAAGPVSGVSLAATLDHESGDSWDVGGTTDANGQVSLKVNRASAGCYTTTVTDVSADGYNWDGSAPVNQFCK